MENRLELQQSNAAREINQIDQRYFRDQTKPGIDLVGSYGVVGLAGAVNSRAINPFSLRQRYVRGLIFVAVGRGAALSTRQPKHFLPT